jgi:hypothetical protein
MGCKHLRIKECTFGATSKPLSPMSSSFHRPFVTLVCFIGLVVIAGCNTEDGDDPNPCPTPDFYLQNNQSTVGIYISDVSAFGYYEIQYGSNGFSLGSGTVATINAGDQLNNLNNGSYDIYVRGNCGGSSWSDWGGPTSFLITGGPSGNCPMPSNFSVNPSVSTAYIDWFHSGSAGYFQVEYGFTGFQFGNGISINVPYSSTTLTGLTSNRVYDYYVRANCGGTEFSAWTGPHSFVTQ